MSVICTPRQPLQVSQSFSRPQSMNRTRTVWNCNDCEPHLASRKTSQQDSTSANYLLLQGHKKPTLFYAQGHKMPPSRHNIMPKVTKCHQADTILCTCSQSPPPSLPLLAQPNLQFYFAVGSCTNIKKICWQKIPNVSASFMKPLELCDALTTYLYAKILWLAHVLGWLFPPNGMHSRMYMIQVSTNVLVKPRWCVKKKKKEKEDVSPMFPSSVMYDASICCWWK